jgi:chorismate mutase
VLKPLEFPKILYPNTVNVNSSILSFYTRQIVPRITRHATLQLSALKRANGITGDAEYEEDGNYGSAATIDIEVLQAISKRVHYGLPSLSFVEVLGAESVIGKFVSESKFLEKPSDFIPHIQNPNRIALEALIAKPEVEKKLLQRLRKKATLYAQDIAPDGEPTGSGSKVDVDGVVELYEHYIIPLTKEVEVGAAQLKPYQYF